MIKIIKEKIYELQELTEQLFEFSKTVDVDLEVKKADYVIEIDTQDVNPFDFKQSNKCYKYGYLQAKKEIDNIKKMIYKED